MLPHFAALVLVGWLSLVAHGQTLVLRARELRPVSGPVQIPGVLVIEKGKIQAIGTKAEIPAGAQIIDVKDAVLFPGFVDGASYLGARSHRDETTEPYQPRLRMSDALDASDPAFDLALRAGITTFHVIPGPRNPVGGLGVVLKRGTASSLLTLASASGLALSLSEEEFERNREPTSTAGALALIAGLRTDARTGWFQGGRERTFLHIGARRELARAEEVSRLTGHPTIPIATASSVSETHPPKKALSGFFFRPLLPEVSDEDRSAPQRVLAREIPVAFCSLAPLNPPTVLRLSAVVARLGGLSAANAEAALTLAPARLLGVSDRVGSLEVGKDGDVLVLTHDPSDARARVLMVVVNGHVHVDVRAKE